jgi:hypothetical protein
MILYSFNTTAAAIGLKMGEKVFYDYLANWDSVKLQV